MKTVFIRVKAEDATHYAQEYDLPVDKEIPIKEVPITDLLPSEEIKEAKQIIQNLKAYGMIHTVEGVSYVDGSHKEFMDRAEIWLQQMITKEQ